MKTPIWTKADQLEFNRLGSKYHSFLAGLVEHKEELEKILNTELTIDNVQQKILNQESLMNFLKRLSQ